MFYRYYIFFKEEQSENEIRNGKLDHETPLYVILNNNK